jgi:glycosyltransferase involved in cell wall biosynthesis
MSLPRLLLCCFDVVPAPTALSRRISEYLKRASEHFQIDLLTVKTADHAHIERYCGARLLRVPVGSGSLLARADVFDRAVRRQLESEEYELVHCFDPIAGYALCELRESLQYRVVVEMCSFLSVEWALQANELGLDSKTIAKIKRQELFCLMNADAIVVANPLTREFILTMGAPRELIHVLRAPVDLVPYVPALMGAPDESTMRVAILGSISEGRGLRDVIAAAAQIEAEHPKLLTVSIVGAPTAFGEELQAHSAQTDLTNVLFESPVSHDDLHKVAALCDLGLIACDGGMRSDQVGSSVSQLPEFFAAGRAVLIADVPMARAVAPEQGVIWYLPGQSDSLAQQLVALALDAPLRRILGAQARALSKLWDADRCRMQLYAIYRDLLGAAPRRIKTGEHAPLNPTTEAVTQLGAMVMDDSSPRVDLRQSRKKESPTNPGIPEPTPVGIVSTSTSSESLEMVNDDDVQEIEESQDDGLHTAQNVLGDREGEIDVINDSAALSIHEDDLDFPQSHVNPWLAQLIFGYCPPERQLFERHTPPTTMPGKS